MDIAAALEFLRQHHRCVLVTRRSDGSVQTSPVLVGVDATGYVVVSATEDRAKVRNLRRDPRASVCSFTDNFFGAWVQVDGTAEIVSLPDAEEGLVAYYRGISGEHPDWADYRASLHAERRVLVRITVDRATGS